MTAGTIAGGIECVSPFPPIIFSSTTNLTNCPLFLVCLFFYPYLMCSFRADLSVAYGVYQDAATVAKQGARPTSFHGGVEWPVLHCKAHYIALSRAWTQIYLSNLHRCAPLVSCRCTEVWASHW